MSCSKDSAGKNEPNFSKLIGKKYTNYSDLDPSLSGGAFGTVEGSDKYSLTICAKKGWGGSKDSPRKALILFTMLMGYSGNRSIQKVINVLYIDLKDYPLNSNIGLDDCTLSGTKDYSTISVYQYEKSIKTENGLIPEKAWRPDTASGKFIEIEPKTLLCQPENAGEGEGEGE